MGTFEEEKPRSAKAMARKREQNRMRDMRELLGINDEATFREALKLDYGLKEGDAKFKQCVELWRSARR